ncbi:High mobility group protein DSP1 [Orchesella cincta]|uniref:High mobility group protein DSP1 n=1 Tax=Orchesella cincta TaxID=48709 RepID=A0A1D2MQP2_ORCCI|nr:High mobility group protein DSP1 [Orchesella cincta]
MSKVAETPIFDIKITEEMKWQSKAHCEYIYEKVGQTYIHVGRESVDNWIRIPSDFRTTGESLCPGNSSTQGFTMAEGQVPQPRAASSAYACFMQHFCHQVQSTGGQQAIISSDLSKVASERWKGMTEDEKKPYKELSNKDKARYQQEMARLNPGTLVTVTSTTTGRKRKLGSRKAAKDPNAPKRATTAFFFFAQVERSKVRAEHPEYKVTEVSKELGKMWGLMKPEEKEQYEQMAVRDRERYQHELKKYNASQEGQGTESEED